VAEQREGETWGGRFLDYLGLGLILTATDILVREGAIRLAGALYIVGGIILFAGLNWKTLRHKFAGSTVNRLETIGVDPRYWLAVFALLLICARITMILPFAENAATPVNGVVVPRSDYDEQSAKLAKANDEIATLTQQRERAAQILAEIQQQIEVMKSRLEER